MVIREESPTNTEHLQDIYRQELAARFERLRGVLEETIVENDALDIGDGATTRIQEEHDIEAREDFEFEQNPVKQVEFRNQLQEWIDEGILEPVSDEEARDGEHYTAFFVQTGYAEGLRFADEQLIERGREITTVEDPQTLLSRPIHRDELEVIYTRNYQNLKDITEDIDRSVSQVLAQAIRDGWGTRKTGDAISNEVDIIQNTRGKTFARTEMLHAHNTGAINRYDEFGIEQVEILTHTPCPICVQIESGDPYSLSEARGLVPAHPNCVCTVAPIV